MSDEHLLASPPRGWRPDGIYDGKQFQPMIFPRIVFGADGQRYKAMSYHHLNVIVRGLSDGTDVSNFMIK